MHLTGSKLGCGEGGCGACTVMVSSYDREEDVIKHVAVNACLTPLCSVAGMAITTVEGIGSTRTSLHPVQVNSYLYTRASHSVITELSPLNPLQERIARAHGSQCGFCTPGFVMSMYTLLRNNPTPSEEIEAAFEGESSAKLHTNPCKQLLHTLSGNLCRCTGYRPILEGYKTFSKVHV